MFFKFEQSLSFPAILQHFLFREDLVHTILVRSIFGVMLCVIIKVYHLSLKPWPMDYYICTGSEPPNSDPRNCSDKFADSMAGFVSLIIMAR